MEGSADREEVCVSDSRQRALSSGARQPSGRFARACRGFAIQLACMLSLLSASNLSLTRASTDLVSLITSPDADHGVVAGPVHAAGAMLSHAVDPSSSRIAAESSSVPELDEGGYALDEPCQVLPTPFADFRKLVSLPGIPPLPPLALIPLRC